MERFGDLAKVFYTIAPKAGTRSKPVAVSMDHAWLERRQAYSGADKRLVLPVFGLYANYRNTVSVSLTFSDGSRHDEQVTMDAPALYRVELDGALSTTALATTTFTNFHHDLAAGKTGLLAEMDAIENGVANSEATLAELSATGQVLKQWNMAQIFRDTMLAQGDDPSNFVRDGVDWFHMNSAIYSSADDSLIVSSREQF